MTAGGEESEALTDRSRKAIGRADLIARRRGARAIDTHHLLLALVQPGSGVGAEVLAEMGLEGRAVSRAIDRIDPPREREAVPGRMPLTRQTEVALELAGEAARVLGHEMIGTEHLLLGLLDQGTGAAAAVLAALGVRAQEVREVLVRRLMEGLPGRLKGLARGGPRRRFEGPEGRFRA